MPKLSREERSVVRSYERDEWKQVKQPKQALGKYAAYARATFLKNRRVNIRISAKDLSGIQQRAVEEGIPYQTLMASIIHKYVSGYLTQGRGLTNR